MASDFRKHVADFTKDTGLDPDNNMAAYIAYRNGRLIEDLFKHQNSIDNGHNEWFVRLRDILTGCDDRANAALNAVAPDSRLINKSRLG